MKVHVITSSESLRECFHGTVWSTNLSKVDFCIRRSVLCLIYGADSLKEFPLEQQIEKSGEYLIKLFIARDERRITSLSSRGHVMLAQNFSWSKTTHRKLQKLLNDDKSATYLFFHKLNKTWRILEKRNFLITATKVNPSTISEDLWTFHVSLLKFFPLLLRSTHNYKQVEQIF